ncbi:MAG TPA: glycosyl hydrolase [Gammaproteobacteria bacterium]|nr:glycosyl hydrolase [Gammaproteobacteria bacterium]
MVNVIAFYLPQFHPIKENDEWWGVGFTEWRNVVNARPRFPGHYQPHLPADLGFYDLRIPEVREAQADLARQYGVHGFCYYHYWFNGRRVLDRPFDEVLASGSPNFPFCLCWANENWTRVWDGGEKNILLEQKHSVEDDVAHIRSLFPAFRDERYIRINGKPLFLVYRTEILPDAAKTAEVWRDEAHKAGIGDIYLARVEQFVNTIDPAGIGFDAAVEFAPSGDRLGEIVFRGALPSLFSKLGLLSRAYAENDVISYNSVARVFKNRADPQFKRFHCVSPCWDNSARRQRLARIIVDSTPQLYEDWLRHTVKRTVRKYEGDERIVFINAWNEWAEGCHLEPDLRWGRAYLEATSRALRPVPDMVETAPSSSQPSGRIGYFKQQYWRARKFTCNVKELLRQLRLPGRYPE